MTDAAPPSAGPHARTSARNPSAGSRTLAIWAFVLALMGPVAPLLGQLHGLSGTIFSNEVGVMPLLGQLAALVGVVLAVVALAKRRPGKGLALGGLCVGGASVLLTILWVSILVPQARESSRITASGNNVLNILEAAHRYAGDHNGCLPERKDDLLPYLGGEMPESPLRREPLPSDAGDYVIVGTPFRLSFARKQPDKKNVIVYERLENARRGEVLVGYVEGGVGMARGSVSMISIEILTEALETGARPAP